VTEIAVSLVLRSTVPVRLPIGAFSQVSARLLAAKTLECQGLAAPLPPLTRHGKAWPCHPRVRLCHARPVP
jgi:hypothetical protein